MKRWFYRTILRCCEIHGCKLDTEGYTPIGTVWGWWCPMCWKDAQRIAERIMMGEV